MKKKDKILALLKTARKEWQTYKRTEVFKHWRTSCKAVWKAFVLLLEMKTGRKLKGWKEIKTEAYKLEMKYSYAVARSVHISAEGNPVIIPEELEADIKKSISQIEDELDLNIFEAFFQKHPLILPYTSWTLGLITIALAGYGLWHSLAK